MPSNYLFLKVDLTEDIRGGAYLDHLLKVKYLSTGAIKDINGFDVRMNNYARIWLNTFDFFPEDLRREAELYGKLTLGFIFGALGFWLTISVFTKTTVYPCVMLILAA